MQAISMKLSKLKVLETTSISASSLNNWKLSQIIFDTCYILILGLIGFIYFSIQYFFIKHNCVTFISTDEEYNWLNLNPSFSAIENSLFIGCNYFPLVYLALFTTIVITVGMMIFFICNKACRYTGDWSYFNIFFVVILLVSIETISTWVHAIALFHRQNDFTYYKNLSIVWSVQLLSK